MYINPINNQTFEAKKFRLIVDDQIYTRVGTMMTNFKTTGKYVREFSNPKAEELYKKAQQTRDMEEKIQLYDQMGHYELKRLNIKERLHNTINKLLMDYLF